jgi:membrane protease YdiL (CAAX protease family)
MAVMLAGVTTQIHRYSRSTPHLTVILIAFALQLALYWLPGFPSLRERLEAYFSLPKRALAGGAALLIPYVVYGAGTGTWGPVPALKLLAITVIVLGIYPLIPAKSQALSCQDATVLLVTAAPLYIGWYRDIWPAPVYLDVMARMFVISLAAFAMLSLRLLADVGYVWRLETGDWAEGAKQLVFFSAIGVPLGFAMRFIAWHPRKEGIGGVAFSFAGILLFIAVAEELFFRGMLQNLIEKSITNKYVARGIASAIFGLSHIHHGFPNWRYAILAAIAGWFYGTAWHNRRSILAAALTHAAVDTLWRHFLEV